MQKKLPPSSLKFDWMPCSRRSQSVRFGSTVIRAGMHSTPYRFPAFGRVSTSTKITGLCVLSLPLFPKSTSADGLALVIPVHRNLPIFRLVFTCNTLNILPRKQSDEDNAFDTNLFFVAYTLSASQRRKQDLARFRKGRKIRQRHGGDWLFRRSLGNWVDERRASPQLPESLPSRWYHWP